MFLCVFLTACQSEQKDISTKKYFDLSGLVEKQIEQLSTEKRGVKKMVSANTQTESQRVQKVDWRKELAPFLQADLNKPAFAQSYDVLDTLGYKSYTLKAGEKLPVQFVAIRQGKVQTSINALITDENYLFKTEKNLRMVLENNRLQAYKIEGFQKLFFGEVESFLVEGKVD